MDLIVRGDECPVCSSGPLGYVKCGEGLYIRCVECSTYWSMNKTIMFDNHVDVNEESKDQMRPATLDEIRVSDITADVAGRWSHANGFTSI